MTKWANIVFSFVVLHRTGSRVFRCASVFSKHRLFFKIVSAFPCYASVVLRLISNLVRGIPQQQSHEIQKVHAGRASYSRGHFLYGLGGSGVGLVDQVLALWIMCIIHGTMCKRIALCKTQHHIDMKEHLRNQIYFSKFQAKKKPTYVPCRTYTVRQRAYYSVTGTSLPDSSRLLVCKFLYFL